MRLLNKRRNRQVGIGAGGDEMSTSGIFQTRRLSSTWRVPCRLEDAASLDELCSIRDWMG